MADRATRDAVSDAAPLPAARAAAGAERPAAAAPPGGGAGAGDPLVAELRKGGLLPLLVLHVLGQQPSYGNQLMERVTSITGGLLKVNPNTMYPLLRQLENRGLVAGEWEHPERRSRRFYRLTDEGQIQRDALRAELEPRLDAVARGVRLVRVELGL